MYSGHQSTPFGTCVGCQNRGFLFSASSATGVGMLLLFLSWGDLTNPSRFHHTKSKMADVHSHKRSTPELCCRKVDEDRSIAEAASATQYINLDSAPQEQKETQKTRALVPRSDHTQGGAPGRYLCRARARAHTHTHTHLYGAERSPLRRRQRLHDLALPFFPVLYVKLDLLLCIVHDGAVPAIEPGEASAHPRNMNE